ncbi:DNA-3-methyladenine glycosylase [Paenibacillus xerothermodurans]|uniref:Putative 3-methyladenine DNA glycosylase n=1 Tax=Paenibacillus xerothermodurans TaxID=1977292 RepID=A0A2W1N855_PAEXE|nr:DNA-3-methyladenine glycosylase [Paenibacillus xerothermodurans]PZE19800.1 DNA-3-methyladenine glycosylase [Paenibacillus xerothermodurans]
MMHAILEQDTVAHRLIGCHLVRQTPHGTIRVEITETEAYKGRDDPASHAYRAVTPRNRLMFGEVGRLYVYLIYGLHYCMNVVAHEPGNAGAVLLRAAEPVEGLELIRANRPGVADRNLLNGPGKLAQGLGVDIGFNGYDLMRSPDRQLALHISSKALPVAASPRIGISQAKELLWRFTPSD